MLLTASTVPITTAVGIKQHTLVVKPFFTFLISHRMILAGYSHNRDE